MKEKFNIVFILVDQMRYSSMAPAGEESVITPNLTHMAEEGVIFENAVSNSPVCTPSRGSLLTGKYPMSHLATANDLPLKTGQETLGTILKQKGYKTGYIGKWHLDGIPRDKFTPPGERRFGFDFWAAYDCHHDYFNGKYYTDTPKVKKIKGYEPFFQTEMALKFIEENRKNPFLCFISFGPPHNPYGLVPEKYKNLYPIEKIKLRENVPENNIWNKTEEEIKKDVQGYYAHITALDECVGKIMKRLESLNLREKTIVIFTSDHGDMLYSQGYQRKQLPFEESIRIPFIISHKGIIPEGYRDKRNVLSVVDIFPTILSLLDVELPEGVEGKDLSGAILRKEIIQKESLIMDIVPLDESIEVNKFGKEWRGLRTDRYTYVEMLSGPWLLFDNHKDPFQRRNLIDSNIELKKNLHKQLIGKLNEIGDNFEKWDDVIRALDLKNLWNEREKEMNKKNPRIVK